jgi:hypothetical protein
MLSRAPASWAGDDPGEPEVLLLRPRCFSAGAVLCGSGGKEEMQQQQQQQQQQRVDPNRTSGPVGSAVGGIVAGAEAADRPESSSSACEDRPSATPSRGTDLSALYRAGVDAYNPSQQDEPTTTSRPNTPRERPTQTPPSPPVELVECDDGAVRPAIGLCFAFVAAPEKMDLMLTSTDGQCGEGILNTRRRASLEAVVPMIQMDPTGTKKLDCEVQRIVAQRRAPKPRKMRKPTKARSNS